MSKQLVYISSPYSHETGLSRADNLICPIGAREIIRTMGVSVTIPAMHSYWDSNPEIDRGGWIRMCEYTIPSCTAVVRVGGDSEKTAIELSIAGKSGVPVFYSISKLDDWLFREFGLGSR